MINNLGEQGIEPADLDTVRLFNLELDPGERYDFSDKQPELVEELKRMLVEFDRTELIP